jgi:hypothetical protein
MRTLIRNECADELFTSTSACVQVCITKPSSRSHEASEKRQGTKSRAGRGLVSPTRSMGI